MTKTFTVEQLISAIRDADELVELKRLVGPSAEQNELAKERLEKIEGYWRRYGYDWYNWPDNARFYFGLLQKEQEKWEMEWGL